MMRLSIICCLLAMALMVSQTHAQSGAKPKVIPLSLEAVGSGLLGIMKRTLQLPVKVIQPVLSGEEKN